MMSEKFETTAFWIKVGTYGITKVSPAISKMKKLAEKGEELKCNILAAETVQKWSAYCIKAGNWKVSVHGIEKIPKDKPVLFVPNHQSYGDIPILLHALRDFRIGFVVRETMAKLPFINQLVDHMKCVPINVYDVRESAKALNQTIENIKAGYSMVIFPEGRRTFSNIPEKFKNGAFKIAKKTGVTIVPIYLHNVHRAFEGNGHVLGHPHITVSVLDPIDTSNMTRNDVSTLNERVYESILDYSRKFNN